MQTTRDLRGMTVVITGASSGIGEATAYAFAEAGATLVLAARNEAALQGVASNCRSLGAERTLVVPTDVTDPDAVKQLAARARALDGRIDVWFSNVGVGAIGPFHETPIAAHHQVVKANLLGHINDAHAALPIFIAQRRGIFINMISLGAFAPTPYAAAYTASKYALKGLSEALRGELSGYPDIHVCDVYPGFIDTPGLSHGANYVGRAISAPPPVYDARRVARAVVRLALAPRPSTVVGSFVHLVRIGHLLAPTLVGRAMASFTRAGLRRAERVPTSDGNLFAPPAYPGGIDGGLRAGPMVRAARLAAGIAVLAAAGFLVGKASAAARRRRAR